MPELESLVAGLCDRNPNAGYACLVKLQEGSRRSDTVYPCFDRFVKMLDSDNSYIRARGLLLIAANARWDKDNKIDEIIDYYLTHITDVKPTVARQFIAVPPFVKRKAQDNPSGLSCAFKVSDIHSQIVYKFSVITFLNAAIAASSSGPSAVTVTSVPCSIPIPITWNSLLRSPLFPPA